MTDTTDEIYQIQLKIWMSKSPAERLRQTLLDNDNLYALWDELKKNIVYGNNSLPDNSK